MTVYSLSKLLFSFIPSPKPPTPNITSPPSSASLQLSKTPSVCAPPVTATFLPKRSTRDDEISSVAWPSLANANIFRYFNVQIKVADDEPEEKIVKRFRGAVLRAGILQECKRRRFFESRQEKRKRKARSAAQRNRKRISVRTRRPRPRTPTKEEFPKQKDDDDDDDDNWDVPEGDIPYC